MYRTVTFFVYTSIWCTVLPISIYLNGLYKTNLVIRFVSVKDALSSGSFIGLYYGLLWWVIFGLRKGNIEKDINTVEVLRWSWKGACKGLLKGILWGGVVGFVIASLEHIISTSVKNDSLSLDVWLIIGVIVVILFVTGFSISGGLVSSISANKTNPIQGIKLSIKNALIYAFIGCLTFCLFAILFQLSWVAYTDGIKQTFKFSSLKEFDILDIDGIILINGIFAPSVTFLIYGGFDVIKHFVLRCLMIWRNYSPVRYVQFLNHTVQLILLQRIGGSYVFIHRLLLEHFASLRIKMFGDK